MVRKQPKTTQPLACGWLCCFSNDKVMMKKADKDYALRGKIPLKAGFSCLYSLLKR